MSGMLDGFLEQVVGSMGATAPQAQAQHRGVAESVLEMLSKSAMGGAAPAGTGTAPVPAGPGGIGGLDGLVRSFEGAGLASVVQSWISTGQNIPATPQQIEQGLGPSQVNGMASKLGMNPQQLLPILAMVLPLIVDKLTPHGEVPKQHTGEPGLGSLLGAAASFFNQR